MVEGGDVMTHGRKRERREGWLKRWERTCGRCWARRLSWEEVKGGTQGEEIARRASRGRGVAIGILF